MICFAFSMAEMLSEVLVVGFGTGEGREGFQLLFHLWSWEFPLLGGQEKCNR